MIRNDKGQFIEGNPGGGRPCLPAELKAMCQAAAPEAIKVALEILNDIDKPPASRIKAAEVILDRGYGKAPQSLTGEDGKPLTIGLVEIVLNKK